MPRKIMTRELRAKKLTELVGKTEYVTVDGGYWRVGWKHPRERQFALIDMEDGEIDSFSVLSGIKLHHFDSDSLTDNQRRVVDQRIIWVHCTTKK